LGPNFNRLFIKLTSRFTIKYDGILLEKNGISYNVL